MRHKLILSQVVFSNTFQLYLMSIGVYQRVHGGGDNIRLTLVLSSIGTVNHGFESLVEISPELDQGL